MSKTDPRIQRISLEEIQEFNHLDLYNLPVNTQGKLVVLAYDTVSKTFVYSYSEGITNNSGKLTLFYGHADDIANFSNDSNKPASIYRPSILGFADGDGIIVEKDSAIESTPPLKRLDFYEVSIKKDIDGNIIEDTYVFRGSLVGQKGDKGDKGDTGEQGESAYSYVPSFMFVRCDSAAMSQVRPVGKYLALNNGVYILQGSDPAVSIGGATYTFTDGIPDYNPSIFPNNSKRIWMIQGVLNSKDHLGPANPFQWGEPKVLADSAVVDFEYRGGISTTVAGPKPAPPNGTGTDGWYSSPDDVPGGAFWAAQRNWSEGPGAQWVVYQIRGECAVGNMGTMGTPATPTVVKNTTGVVNGIDIYAYPAAQIGGAVNFKEHRIYVKILGSGGATSSILIATIPHVAGGGEHKYTYSSPHDRGQLLYFYTVSIDTVDNMSPASAEASIAFCEPISFYKTGLSTAAEVKTFLDNASGSVSDNKPYHYIGKPLSVNTSTFYPEDISTGPVFDGKGLWYFEYLPSYTTMNIHRINSSGKIVETVEIVKNSQATYGLYIRVPPGGIIRDLVFKNSADEVIGTLPSGTGSSTIYLSITSGDIFVEAPYNGTPRGPNYYILDVTGTLLGTLVISPYAVSNKVFIGRAGEIVGAYINLEAI